MILLALLLSLPTAEFSAAAPTDPIQQLTSPDQVPEGLAESDWQSIRAATQRPSDQLEQPRSRQTSAMPRPDCTRATAFCLNSASYRRANLL